MTSSVAGEGEGLVQLSRATIDRTLAPSSAAGGVIAEDMIVPRSWKFTIPSLPPSVNALYQIIYSQRRVELKPECRRWKSDAKGYVTRVQLREGLLVSVDATFYYRLNYANGKPRVFDAANLLKILIDCIAEKCGFNDCLVRHGSWTSIDDVNERVEVNLMEVR